LKPALRMVCSVHSRKTAIVVYEEGRAVFRPVGSTTAVYLDEAGDGFLSGQWCRECTGEHWITVPELRRAISRRDRVIARRPFSGQSYRGGARYPPEAYEDADDVLSSDQ
jgi:hypothetical protein